MLAERVMTLTASKFTTTNLVRGLEHRAAVLGRAGIDRVKLEGWGGISGCRRRPSEHMKRGADAWMCLLDNDSYS